jgi:hypothetical protein
MMSCFGYQGGFCSFKRIGAAKVRLEISETKSGLRFPEAAFVSMAI